MILKARFLMVLVVVAALAVLACGDSDDAAPGAGGTDTPAAVPTSPADAPSTSAVSSKHNPELKGAMPANFPDDVPIYPGADIEFSRSSNDLAMSVRLTTDDSVETVTSELSDGFAAKGWATQTNNSPDGPLIVADKLSRKAAASITQNDEGRTQIDLLVQASPH